MGYSHGKKWSHEEIESQPVAVVIARYFVPASEAKVRTISIMASGKGKYERFRDRPEEIKKLVMKTF